MKKIGLVTLLENNQCTPNDFFKVLNFNNVEDFKKAKEMISGHTSQCKSEYCKFYDKQKNDYSGSDKNNIPDISDICNTQTNSTQTNSTDTNGTSQPQQPATTSTTSTNVCDNKYFKFKTRDGKETCLGNWKAVLDLVQGNPDCYDSIKKTVKVPATPSRAAHYTKRTFYRVFKVCVTNSDREYELQYTPLGDEDRGRPQTTPPTRIPPSDTPRQRSSGTQPPVKREENTNVKPTPTFTGDEQYILDLFDDDK